MANMHLICTGNPVDGFNFVGPFGLHEEAVLFAQSDSDDDSWWVVEVDYPPSGMSSIACIDKSELFELTGEEVWLICTTVDSTIPYTTSAIAPMTTGRLGFRHWMLMT